MELPATDTRLQNCSRACRRCAVVLKPAEYTPPTAISFAEISEQAAFTGSPEVSKISHETTNLGWY